MYLAAESLNQTYHNAMSLATETRRATPRVRLDSFHLVICSITSYKEEPKVKFSDISRLLHLFIVIQTVTGTGSEAKYRCPQLLFYCKLTKDTRKGI